MKLITMVLISIGLSACGTLQRSDSSGYANYNTISTNPVKEYYNDQMSAQEVRARTELGISKSKPLNETEVRRLNTRITLNRLEGRLTRDKVRKQYYHYKPMIRNDNERIQFLRIPTYEGRERYANSRNLVKSFNNFDDGTLKMIEQNDIAVGMNQQAVRESWGDPDAVNVAGNEIYGNQAWSYTKMVSSDDGYTKQHRVIYFENGRVIGWESY